MPYTQITHDSRHPFETYILGAALMGGLPALTASFAPPALAEVFPPLAQQIWGICFSGGALLALVGISWRNRSDGITMEQVGLIAVAACGMTYVACLIIFLGLVGAWPSIWLFFLLSLACVRQWMRLQKFVKGAIAADLYGKGILRAARRRRGQ